MELTDPPIYEIKYVEKRNALAQYDIFAIPARMKKAGYHRHGDTLPLLIPVYRSE